MAFGNGPKIVTNGLVLSLDAADRNSYSGTGTAWNDLSGNGNNGSFVNSPTFSGSNGGSLNFNGSSNYTTFGDILDFGVNSATIISWINLLWFGIIGSANFALPILIRKK
jgi:hypothetical protein